MKSSTIILATRNKGKISEFASLLAPFHLKVIGLEAFPQMPDVEETGQTFEENALLKAHATSKFTGLVAIADDSGLEVDFLNKAPGVYSARYSATASEQSTDQKNLELVLHQLKGVPKEKRTGRFVCCMAAATPSGQSIVAQKAWEGILTEAPEGANGFGYDPIFFDPHYGCTAAQMTKEQKNSRSHRSMAVLALLEKWPGFWNKWLEQAK